MCLRCEKARFTCAGFKEAVFVDASEQAMKQFTCKPKEVGSILSTSRISSTTTTKAFSSQLDDAVNPVTSPVHCWQIPQSSTQLSDSVPMSPHISLNRDEMYVLYTIRHLVKGPSAMMYCNVLQCNSPTLHPHQSMMNQCLLALAKVFYGLHNHESRVIQQGMHLYGRGLGTLREVLGKAKCTVTTEMIVTVLALSVGEVCTLPF